MVVVPCCFNCGLASSVLLDDLVEVRVFDANLSFNLTVLVEHCHLCIPFVDVYAEVHLLSLRDAGA